MYYGISHGLPATVPYCTEVGFTPATSSARYHQAGQDHELAKFRPSASRQRRRIVNGSGLSWARVENLGWTGRSRLKAEIAWKCDGCDYRRWLSRPLADKQRALAVDIHREKKHTVAKICKTVDISMPTLSQYVKTAGG